MSLIKMDLLKWSVESIMIQLGLAKAMKPWLNYNKNAIGGGEGKKGGKGKKSGGKGGKKMNNLLMKFVDDVIAF